MTTQNTRPVHTAGIERHHDLGELGVRELIAELSSIEDELRGTPFMVRRHGMMVVNPEVAPLLARQRAVSAQLRQRRVSWAAHPAGRRRGQSASWPAPPWT
jgi:hypothetical protein